MLLDLLGLNSVRAGSASSTLSGMTQSATGAEVYSGTISQQLGTMRQSLAAVLVLSGAVAQAVARLRQSAQGVEVLSAVSLQHVGSLSQAATVNVPSVAPVAPSYFAQGTGGGAQLGAGRTMSMEEWLSLFPPRGRQAEPNDVVVGIAASAVRGLGQRAIANTVSVIDLTEYRRARSAERNADRLAHRDGDRLAWRNEWRKKARGR